MKKLFLLLISLFTIIFTLSGCTKKEYSIVLNEINDEKFNYVEIIDDNNESNSVVCNYVKTVWGGNSDTFDVHDTIIRYSFTCDFNKNYQIKINLPTHKLFKITNVSKYYFYDFNYEDDNEVLENIDYEINDYVMTLNVDFEEFNNSHVFQYYKVHFKIDKTHFGYYYFGIRYGNELKSITKTFTFLKDFNSNTLEYLEITLKENTYKISNVNVQDTLMDLINALYLIKLDLNDYTFKDSMHFKFKILNEDLTYIIQIDENMICHYEGNYYRLIAKNNILMNYIRTI